MEQNPLADIARRVRRGETVTLTSREIAPGTRRLVNGPFEPPPEMFTPSSSRQTEAHTPSDQKPS